MKNWVHYIIILGVALFLLLPLTQPVMAGSLAYNSGTDASSAGLYADIFLSPRIIFQGIEGDKLVLGGSFTLEVGEKIEGRLIVLGGSAFVANGAEVEGDTVIMGGSLNTQGVIHGDVLILGGLAEIGSTAVIFGDISTVSGNLELDPRARVEGTVHENLEIPWSLPGNIETPVDSQAGAETIGFSLVDGLYILFRSFTWAALAILIVLFFPANSQRVGKTVISNPVISGGLGLITALVALVILVVVAITIIGIPLSILIALGLLAAWAFGMVVIGIQTGERFSHLVNQEWTLPVRAGIGTFLVTLVMNSIGDFIPCVGWLAPVIVGSIGLGATLLTVFGSRDYPEV